jgi:hypothetical protein
MILRQKILNQMESKRGRFADYDHGFRNETEAYRQALQQMMQMSASDLRQRAESLPTPGALPTEEFDEARALRLPFPERWNNHEESRHWAARILLGCTTFAADGSQIPPVKDFSIPVAAIQVAWFINHHTATGDYVKDVDFEILAPDELEIEFAGEKQISDQAVNLRRFEFEVATLCRIMQQLNQNRLQATSNEVQAAGHRSRPDDASIQGTGQGTGEQSTTPHSALHTPHSFPTTDYRLSATDYSEFQTPNSELRTPNAPFPALGLFDNSLVISFADRMQPAQREQYVALILQLLRCSEQTGIPLIGYVDTSQARDLVHLLGHCFGAPQAERIHDAQLVGELLAWGDRTPLFVCARGSADKKQQSVLESYAEYRRGIGFTYLKTTATTPPVRLDIPLWIQERGWLDEVMDLVRAEVVVGNGYPYVIETADAAAVLTAKDREAFYAIFQKFAADEGIALRLSQKATSKARRR